MLIGSVRVSTNEQSLDLRLGALATAGRRRVFTDKDSITQAHHPGLAEAVSQSLSRKAF
jgi:DNA invertase Pin-like site-specific DNA recombinase